MLGLRRRLLPGVAGLVAAVAAEATGRLAALLTEEGGVQFPAALRAAGEADSGHGPSLLRHLGKDRRGPASTYGRPDLSPQQNSGNFCAASWSLPAHPSGRWTPCRSRKRVPAPPAGVPSKGPGQPSP